MNSAQDLSTAVKSVGNGFRPISDSVSLDVSSTSDVDTLLTYALTARSLDTASSALERVLELDSDNEVANAGFTWLLGVRDAAERLEGSGEAEVVQEATIDDDAVEASGLFCSEDVSSEATSGDTVSDEPASGDSGFSAALPFAFQQVVEPLIASNGQSEEEQAEAEAAAKAEEEAKERAEAEAAAKAEEERERAEVEAAAKAEQEEKERAEAEAAAKAEEEEKERAEAEAAAKAEEEEKERAEAEAAAKAEEEEKERAEAEAAAKAEEEAKERAEAEAAAKAEEEEKERAEAAAAAKAEEEEKERAEAEAAAKAEQEEKERAEAEAAAKAEEEEKERAEAEAKAEEEEREKERAEEAEAAIRAEEEEKERAEEAEAAAKAKEEEKEQADAEQEAAIVADAEELADEVHVAAIATDQDEAPVAPVQVPVAGEKLTILTVDDSPTIRKLLMMTLEREGFNVVQAQDGVEALVKMSECNPAMILSDINMPRLDGYKLCKFVKKHAKTKHIPVIMLSGKDGVFDKLRGRMSGCDGYLTKPFESKDLLEKIRSFVGATA